MLFVSFANGWKMLDKYDKAIAILTDDPEQIKDAWLLQHPKCECLFLPLPEIGLCPSMISNGYTLSEVKTPGLRGLVSKIRQMRGLPKHKGDITPNHLQIFAKIQREADQFRP